MNVTRGLLERSWAGAEFRDLEEEEGDVVWMDTDGLVVALESDCSLHTGPQDWFRPSVDIRWAWKVLEKLDSGGLTPIWAIYPTADGYNVEYAHGHEVTQAKTAPEAICLAAIIAKLTESV